MTHETETAHGWEFQIAAVDQAGHTRMFAVRLAWVDYNHWSPDGAARPEAVGRAVLRFVLRQEPAMEVADSFDAARIRRRYPESDEVIPRLID